jgi:hypothetical protein
VKIRRGLWNEELFRVLEGFADLAHDDEVDARSGALEMLNPHMKGFGIFEATRPQAEQLRAEQCPKPQPAQTLPALAPWNGSPRRTNQAEPRQLLRRSFDARCPRAVPRTAQLRIGTDLIGLSHQSPVGGQAFLDAGFARAAFEDIARLPQRQRSGR